MAALFPLVTLRVLFLQMGSAAERLHPLSSPAFKAGRQAGRGIPRAAQAALFQCTGMGWDTAEERTTTRADGGCYREDIQMKGKAPSSNHH